MDGWPHFPNPKSGEGMEWVEHYLIYSFAHHFIHTFHLVVIRRSKEDKYWEWLLHHFLSLALIVFSCSFNLALGGVFISVIHDKCPWAFQNKGFTMHGRMYLYTSYLLL